MVKAFYSYGTDAGDEVYSFLQDTAIAAALGQVPATVGTPRLPDKFKPRRVSVKIGVGVYKRPVVGNVGLLAGLTLGTAILGGTVVGQDGEVNNGQAAF